MPGLVIKPFTIGESQIGGLDGIGGTPEGGIPGIFPPAGPTGLTRVLPSYLYQQYTDDDDLQAFVDAFNALAQNVVDTLNDLNLPIYTQAQIAGPLLDWVGSGLYGLPRPALSSQRQNTQGPLNTYALNVAVINQIVVLSKTAVVATTDDFYKRILTWHLFKADGKVFNVRWLKRRIMRWLTGTDGTSPNIDNSYQVSVSFGTGNNVSIRLLHGLRTVTGGSILNTFALNAMPNNVTLTSYTPYAPLMYAEILQDAIRTGACELPAGFNYTVTI